MLIDTHAHLTDVKYGGAREIIDNMQADGLERIIAVGFNEFTSAYSVKIAEENAKIFAAVGVHPSDAATAGQGYLGALSDLCDSDKCVAIGEIGLDYHYEDTDKRAQHRVLCEQLELVREKKLPAIFHVRDAYGDFYDIISKRRDCVTAGAVMHCFSGSVEMAKAYLDLGLYISFAGPVTFKNARGLTEVAKFVPADRLLSETDSPYLAPEPLRGTVNTPCNVRLIVRKLAELRGESVEATAETIARNAHTLFYKLKRG